MGKNIALLVLSNFGVMGQHIEEFSYPEGSAQRRLERKFLACEDPDAFIWDDAYLPTNGKMNFYTDQADSDHANLFCYQTNEPGTKAIINQCQGKLDSLIILASQLTLTEVYNESGERGTGMKYGPCLQTLPGDKYGAKNHFRQLILKHNEEPGPCKNTFDFFIDQIRHYIEHVKNGKFPDVYVLETENNPSDEDLSNYCFWVARLLMDELWETPDSTLYLETNGGIREAMAMMIGTLRLISNYPIRVEYAFYSEFINGQKSSYDKPFRIQNRKNLYNFFDLVSGLDDFLSSGRSERLIHYFECVHRPLTRTLQDVQRLTWAFTLCQPDDMIKAVKDVAVALKEETRKRESGQCEDGLYGYIIDEIRNDFGKDILESVKNNKSREDILIPIMKWALRKEYLQQVITIFAEKMPDILVKKKILYYEDVKDYKKQECIKQDLETKSANGDSMAYIFIQKYLCLSPYKKDKKDKEPVICYQNLLKKAGNLAADRGVKWINNGRGECYHPKAYSSGTYIENVLKWQSGNNKIPDCQKLYTKLKPSETAEIMREYYSIKRLRDYVNHANTDDQQSNRNHHDTRGGQTTHPSDFLKRFTNYANYDDIKRYLEISIRNVINAIQIIESGDRNGLSIIEMETQFAPKRTENSR